MQLLLSIPVRNSVTGSIWDHRTAFYDGIYQTYLRNLDGSHVSEEIQLTEDYVSDSLAGTRTQCSR